MLSTNNKTSANVSPNNKGRHNKLTRALGRTLPRGEKKFQKRMIFVDELPHNVPQLLSAHNKTSAKGMAN